MVMSETISSLISLLEVLKVLCKREYHSIAGEDSDVCFRSNTKETIQNSLRKSDITE